MTKLNPRQQAFVLEYLKDKNATRAARDAGYAKKDCDVQGPRLLGNVRVRAAINVGLAKQAKRAELTADMVIARIREFALDKKTIKPSDTLKACEMLGKHFNIFTDSVQVTGKGGGPIAFIGLPANGSEAEEYDSPQNPVQPKPDGYSDN